MPTSKDYIILIAEFWCFLGLGKAFEYCECFMGLVVVLCESRVLGVESHDEDSEDDDHEDEEDGVQSYFLRLRLCDGSLEALRLLWLVEVDGLD